jgi:hypothetical protein
MKRFCRHDLLIALCALGTAASLHGQMIIKSPKKNSVLEQHRIGVTVLGKPGAKTWLYVNDVPADSGEIRIDGLYDFLNIEVPDGPIELRTEAVGAGNRLFKAVQQLHIVGPPAKLIPNLECVELPADSQSTASLKISIEDAWGKKISRLKSATVKINNGSMVDPDLDSLSAGTQLPVEESRLILKIRAAKAVGREELSVEVGPASLKIPIRYTTPLVPLIVVGSVDAGISVHEIGMKDASVPKFTLADYTHQEYDWRGVPMSGRMAFYAKGSLKKKYLVTASFDSRRTRDNQLFRDLDPNKQYALYGDASSLTYDALTQSKFYGRIERNESFISVGDFNTDFRSTEFAKYDRSFTGFLGKIQQSSHALTGFATLNDRNMKLDEIRGEGISGYYYLSCGRIVINSDKIRIETRDRYHPERVTRFEELVRYQDYDVNYVDGTLMFKQPVSSVDGEGNPVYVIAVYEYQSNSDKSLIGGLRYDGTWMKKVKLGSTLIIEEKNPSNYVLYGVDASIPVLKWLQFKGEFAQTRAADFSMEKQVGSAYSAELKLQPFSALNVGGYYRMVDDDFLNPSQTGSRFEVGAEKYGFDQSLQLGKYGKIQSQFYRQYNQQGTVNENQVRVANASYEYAIGSKTTARLGFEDAERRQSAGDSIQVRNYRSKMIKGQLSHRWGKRLSSTVEHEQNLAEGRTALPTGSSVGLAFDLTEKVQLFVKQRLLNTTEQHTQTLLGIDSRLNKNTQLTGKYEIGGAAGENLSRATIGLKNRWQVYKDLALNLAFESTATMDSLEVPTPDHSAVSVGFEYLPDKPWKSSGKYELRRDDVVNRQVLTLGSEFKILHGLSAIGRLDWTGARYGQSGDDLWNRSECQLGLAYRPEQSDAFNGIAKVQLLSDKNTHVAPKTKLDRLIVSMHGYWEPASRLEFGARFALRRLLDEEIDVFKSTTTTVLVSLRTEYAWKTRWSTGLDMRLTRLYPIGQVKRGAAADVNFLLKQNMQIGLGYVFKGLDDADFSYSEYTYSNFYLLFRMKFSESIFDWK